MKSIIITVILMGSFLGQSQFNINDYKYVVIPKKFNDFKKENQHLTSTLVKHLFTKKGFTTVYDDNIPPALSSNRCLGLFVDLIDESSMFTTKTALTLKDCEGKEVFLTQQGKSKTKEYVMAYKEAITAAFKSVDALPYTFINKQVEKTDELLTVSFKNDIKKVEEKQKAKKDSMITQVATKDYQSYEDRTPVNSNYKKGEKKEIEEVEQIATKEEQSYKNNKPISTDYKKADPVVTSNSGKTITSVLYAQELPNGYQLVDSTPKIQLKIFKSSMPNVYLAKADDKDGVVYSIDAKWFFEYYHHGEVIVEELEIKF